MGKLINRTPGSRLLISSLPGSALRTHVESLTKPCLVNMIPKDTHLVFSISVADEYMTNATVSYPSGAHYVQGNSFSSKFLLEILDVTQDVE